MKTYLPLTFTHPEALPAAFAHDDVRYPENLVEHFITEYTRAGDSVLDPFAGYGTTLVVAERLGRRAFGVELSPEKAAYARARLKRPESLALADARALAAIQLPPMDFSMTSPPFMAKDDLSDPLTDYKVKGQGYAAYLREMRAIYGQVRRLMKPAATVVVEVSNLKIDGRVTPLAWDLAQAISTVLRFEGEVVVCWDKYGYGYDHSYCLVFSAL